MKIKTHVGYFDKTDINALLTALPSGCELS